jgi:hypothetical protein
LLACNDDDPWYCPGYPFNHLSTITFFAVQGETYYFLVHGWSSSDVGAYTLQVTGAPSAPPNDTCPGTSITAIPYLDFGTTACANDIYPNSDCFYAVNSPEVVYRLNLYATQDVVVSLCGSGFDTELVVGSGGACPGDVIVACNDDAYCDGMFSNRSTVEFTAQAYVDYFIQLSGWDIESGSYVIRVESTTIVRIDSLVAIPNGEVIELYWEDTGALGYFIYRSTSLNPPDLFPNGLWDFSATNSWTDYNIWTDIMFYAVSPVPNYLMPALLASGLGERPIEEVLEDARAWLKANAAPIEPVDFHPYQNRIPVDDPVEKVVDEDFVFPFYYFTPPDRTYENIERAPADKQGSK